MNNPTESQIAFAQDYNQFGIANAGQLYSGYVSGVSGLMVNPTSDPVSPTSISGGDMSAQVSLTSGYLQSSNFITGSAGWQILANGNVEFNTGTFRGALSANSIDIPNTTSADSFHVDTSGNTWWGATTFAAGVASVSKAGAATFTNVTITGGSVATSTLSGTIGLGNLNVANRGWSQTSVFSVTDADTVAWAAGTFTSADGTAYSISSGNTGNMVAKTYVYLDTGVSTTVYQITTTATTAVGAGKVLIAIAQNATGEATFFVLDGQGGQNIDASSIVANSITANEIAASTITGGNIATLNISGKTATFDTGTIGGFTMSATQLSATNFSVTSGASNTARVEVGTGGNTAGVNSANAGGDIAFWAGASHTNRGSAPFYVTAAGDLVATSATISGYLVSSQKWLFGNGTDGASTVNAGITLTRDMYYSSLTINSGKTLTTAGYKVFVNGSFINNGALINDGGAGGNAVDITSAGAAGAAAPGGTLAAGTAGLAGVGSAANAPGNAGTNGTAVNPSLGSNGVGGGAGGAAAGNAGGAASSGGTATAETLGLNYATVSPTTYAAGVETSANVASTGTGATSGATLSPSAGSGSGASGGNTGSAGAFGGGSGASGGVVEVVATTITNNGVIRAAGGNGGNGGTPVAGADIYGGGGGGGGGSGGVVILVYNSYTNSGTVSVAGGTGGTGGTGRNGGVAGSNGTTGGAGKVYQIKIA